MEIQQFRHLMRWDQKSGIEFENVEKKDSYALDLRLVLKYSYPINIEIENR